MRPPRSSRDGALHPVRRIALAACFLAIGAGCADLPKHEVSVSNSLRERPVRSVFIFEPGFPSKTKHFSDDDLAEMKPEHRMETSAQILSVVKEVIGASLLVDSYYTPDESAQAWADAITADLAKGRVPLSVEPYDVPVESVLLLGVLSYGRTLDQVQVRPLPFLPWTKTYRMGKEKWEHVCDLQAILVDPREGTVLLDVRHSARTSEPGKDPEITERMVRETAWALVNAFPIP